MTLIDAKELAAVTSWAMRAVPNSPPTPILSALRLECDGDRLTAAGFDYQTYTEVSTAAEGFLEPVFVSGATLSRAAAVLDGQVTIDVEGEKLTLATGRRSLFRLTLMPAGEYPSTPPTPPLAGDTDGLGPAVALTRESAASGVDSPVLQCVLLHADGSRLNMIASDRYRITETSVPWAGGPFTAAVPNTKAIASAIKDLSGRIQVHTDGNWLVLSAGGRKLATVLHDTTQHPGYARLASLVPKRSANEALVRAPREQLIDAIAKTEITLQPKMPLHLRSSSDGLLLDASQDTGEGLHEVPDAEHHGETIATAYNPAYLRSVVSRVPTTWVQLRWADPATAATKPVHVTGYDPSTDQVDDSVQHVAMPQRHIGA